MKALRDLLAAQWNKNPENVSLDARGPEQN
jgi:hypothetical protein